MDQNKKSEKIEAIDDLTRSQWLLRLGEFVALAGVSGALPEFAAAFPQGRRIDLTQLPPGLYEASQDHLVHALSSAGKSWTPLAGTETEFMQPGFAPPLQFFSAGEFAIVTRVFEILLGNVDPSAISEAARWFDLWLSVSKDIRTAAQNLDPLHRVLAVAYYGEDPVRELETADPPAMARAGLKALHDLSLKLHGHDFLQLTSTEQTEVVTSIAKLQPETTVHKFLELARTEAIRGYYTSAKGLEELDYKGNAYYTECPGCTKPT